MARHTPTRIIVRSSGSLISGGSSGLDTNISRTYVVRRVKRDAKRLGKNFRK
jgi:hypothetical protein